MPSSELLVYALIVAGAMLFSYLMRLIADKAKPRELEVSTTPAHPVFEEAPDYSWGRRDGSTSEPNPLPREAPVSAAAAAPAASPIESTARVHAAVRRLVADSQALRNAIVVLTVLGRCRAIEPHDDHSRRLHER
jgi:hypothetical protein